MAAKEGKNPVPESLSKAKELISGGWVEGFQDITHSKTWSLECAHGTAKVVDVGSTVVSRRDGARYEVEVTPTGKNREFAVKWTLSDAQSWALDRLGFRTDAYDWLRDQQALNLLRDVEEEYE